MLAVTPLRGNFKQSVEILALEAQDADGIDVTELALTHRESRWRNLDGIISRPLAAAKGFENVACLPAAAAAEFSNCNRGCEALHDFLGVPPEQAFIRAREAILGKMADHFKQRGANIVVQIFGREFLLTWFGESGADLGGEFIGCVRSNGMNQHNGDSL